MENRKCVKIVLASPSDVQQEREYVPKVLEEVRKMLAEWLGYSLELYQWETDVHPTFHAKGPQGAIDEALQIEQCDIVIGVFWRRIGSPVHDAKSGTVHELLNAYNKWKETESRPVIMLYFNTAGFYPKSVAENKQHSEVLRFQRRVAKQAVYGEYNGPEEFRDRLRLDLAAVIRTLDPNVSRAVRDALNAPTQPPGSALDAMTRLSRVVKDDTMIPDAFRGKRWGTLDEDLFQDFRIDRETGKNPNPITWFWADTYRGNMINARVDEIDPQGNAPYLRVTFENRPASWPCNIAIYPIGGWVTTRGRSLLTFDARTVARKRSGSGALDEVYLSARVLNARSECWVLGKEARARVHELVAVPHK